MKAVHTVIVVPPKVYFTLIGHFLVSVDPDGHFAVAISLLLPCFR